MALKEDPGFQYQAALDTNRFPSMHIIELKYNDTMKQTKLMTRTSGKKEKLYGNMKL